MRTAHFAAALALLIPLAACQPPAAANSASTAATNTAAAESVQAPSIEGSPPATTAPIRPIRA